MSWSPQANKRLTAITREFKANVQAIADALSNHDSAVQVAPVHVERAFESLSSSGLMRRRWIDRPEAETALGGVFAGASFAAPDVVGCLCDDPHKAFSRATLVALFIIGSFLFAHGTYRGRLPGSAFDERKWWPAIRRMLL